MLTELDGCVLGVIWRDGPMSAYGVRAHFALSTTVAWSASTGTIYPSIRRLRDANFVFSGVPTGPRGSQLLTITDAGLAALRTWICSPQDGLGSATADPIRTRVQFLATLTPAARAEAFAYYRRSTITAIAELRAADAVSPTNETERSEHLGAVGAIMELEARLAWLKYAERELASSSL